MKRVYLIVFLLLLSNPAIAREEERAQQLFMMVKCPTCDGQPIKESNAELAEVLRAIIREKINQGVKDDDILEYLRNSYGDQIVLKPIVTTYTILLWILPSLVLVLGFWIVLTKCRK